MGGRDQKVRRCLTHTVLKALLTQVPYNLSPKAWHHQDNSLRDQYIKTPAYMVLHVIGLLIEKGTSNTFQCRVIYKLPPNPY